MRYCLALLYFQFILSIWLVDTKAGTAYVKVLDKIKSVTNDNSSFSLYQLMFTIESAYFDGNLNYEEYNNAIAFHTERIKQLAAVNRGNLEETDHTTTTIVPVIDNKELEHNREKLLCNWAIYTYITDTTWWKTEVGYEPHYPYEYTFEDPFGEQNWDYTMVSKLIMGESVKGNCFSLSMLFKIFSDILVTDAYLTTAPGHIYIKHKDLDNNWHNIELGTRSFPGNGTIKTLTHSTHEGVKNGIAMRTLNNTDMMSMLIVQLAKGYEKKYQIRGDDFMKYCAEMALECDEKNLNALLLKQQVLEEEIIAYKKTIPEVNLHINELKKDENINDIILELEANSFYIHDLGYRQMNRETYEQFSKPTKEVPLHEIQKFNPNPYKEIGEASRYYSLSEGAYNEIHENKKEYVVGQTRIDMESKIIIGLEKRNVSEYLTIYALSVDPLVHEFPSVSPYIGMGNNPALMVDPNGEKPGFGPVFIGSTEDVERLRKEYEFASSVDRSQIRNKFSYQYVDYIRLYHPEEFNPEMYVIYADADADLMWAIEDEFLKLLSADAKRFDPNLGLLLTNEYQGEARYGKRFSALKRDFNQRRKEQALPSVSGEMPTMAELAVLKPTPEPEPVELFNLPYPDNSALENSSQPEKGPNPERIMTENERLKFDMELRDYYRGNDVFFRNEKTAKFFGTEHLLEMKNNTESIQSDIEERWGEPIEFDDE